MPEPDLFQIGGAAPAAPAPAVDAPSRTRATGADSGLAINNPLNLRPLPKGKWPGQTGVSASGFAIFATPQDGWNAADQNLQAKVKSHGLGTLAGIIGDPQYGWAPARDHNDPATYAGTVAGAAGVKPTDDISQRILTDPEFRHGVLTSMAGVEVGKPVAFGGSGDEPDLMALGGVTNPKTGQALVPGAQYTPGTGAGKPPDPQALAFSFLAKHGFRDENAPLGSSTNPAGQLPGKGIPSEAGSWYVTPQGQLRRTGDETPDYLPTYQKVASMRGAAAAAPVQDRIAAALGQGAVFDVPGSINKLAGGGFSAGDPLLTALSQSQGGPSAFGLAQAGLTGSQQERNQYDLLHHGDPVMAAARFVGQAAPVTALTLGTGEALGTMGPAGEFIAGEGGGNLLTQGLSRATGGALQGAEAAGLTSSTNDRPLAEQLKTGAELGAIGNTALPMVGGLGQRVVYGTPLRAGPAVDLATLARDKYNILVDAGQLRAAAGDRAAATAHSELLGTSPEILASNQSQRQNWMRGVTSTYGDASGDVSPASLDANHVALGGKFNAIADRTPIIDAGTVPGKLDALASDASQVVGANEAKPLRNLIKNIKSTIRPDGTMSGAAYQALTHHNGPLMTAVRKADTEYAGRIKDVLDDAFENSVAPEDVQALQRARFQYKNLMTVEKAAQSAAGQMPDGVLPAGAFRGAVKSNFKNLARFGAGDLGELNDIRQTLMKEPPNSFSADRGAFRLGAVGMSAAAAAETAGQLFNHPEMAHAVLGTILAPKAASAIRNALTVARLGPKGTNRLLGENPPLPLKTITSYIAPPGVIAGQNLLANPLVTQPQP